MIRLAAITLVIGLTGPAAAELTEAQSEAATLMLPALEEALVAQGGDAMAAFAPALSECVVTTAKRRELRAFRDADLSDDDTALLNDIMARPQTQHCLAKALQ